MSHPPQNIFQNHRTNLASTQMPTSYLDEKSRPLTRGLSEFGLKNENEQLSMVIAKSEPPRRRGIIRALPGMIKGINIRGSTLAPQKFHHRYPSTCAALCSRIWWRTHFQMGLTKSSSRWWSHIRSIARIAKSTSKASACSVCITLWSITILRRTRRMLLRSSTR